MSWLAILYSSFINGQHHFLFCIQLYSFRNADALWDFPVSKMFNKLPGFSRVLFRILQLQFSGLGLARRLTRNWAFWLHPHQSYFYNIFVPNGQAHSSNSFYDLSTDPEWGIDLFKMHSTINQHFTTNIHKAYFSQLNLEVLLVFLLFAVFSSTKVVIFRFHNAIITAVLSSKFCLAPCLCEANESGSKGTVRARRIIYVCPDHWRTQWLTGVKEKGELYYYKRNGIAWC